MNVIPPITDPLGQHWKQPSADQILIDDNHALMSKGDFESLYEYSTSIPSGVYDGKMWKAQQMERTPEGLKGSGNWFLRWFAPSEDPKQCAIYTRAILLA